MPADMKDEVIVADARALGQHCSRLAAKHMRNGNVLFVQLPQNLLGVFNPSIAEKKGYYAFPPTGLQCLYEALKGRGLDVRILDLNFLLLKRAHQDAAFDPTQWQAALQEYLDSFDPCVVGVSCMFDAGINALIAALRLLRRWGRCVVLAGGIIPTYEWKKLLQEDLCDFVLQGEAENKINCLMDHLSDKGGAGEPTRGICFRHDGALGQTSGPADIVNFNSDMIDSYSVVPIDEYHRYGSLNPFSRMTGQPFAAVQMNRGCRAKCRFCSVPAFMGRGVRMRPVDAVFGEIEYLVTRRGIRHFEWLDDDLLFKRREFLDLMGRIIRADWNITWSASNGLIAQSLDDEMLSAMRDSGCVGFRIGIETGNAEMLRATRKPATLETFRRMASLLGKYPEMFACGNFMLGFPKETFGQLMDTFRFALELSLDWSGFATCQAIRGAGMFEEFSKVFAEQMRTEGATTRNYIPVRQSARGELPESAGVRRGPEVFRTPLDAVPTPQQVNEIWFAFNLVVNFINNKNLRPGGRPEKFIAWVEMAQAAYPTNPKMNLFLALAHRIRNDDAKAEAHRAIAAEHCTGGYWQQRFEDFGLREVLENFPKGRDEAFERISALRARIARHYNGWDTDR